MMRHLPWLTLLAAGCTPSTPPPAGSVTASHDTPANAARAAAPKRAVAVTGTRYDIREILVPGSVTIVKFTAPW